MKKLFLLLIFLFCTGAGTGSIPAKLASGKPPVPTFEDVHEGFTRLVLNESGWKSRPDINGILQVLLKHGGGRDRSRNYQGSGYGLDYLRFMTYMAKASLKTFPADNPWAYPIMIERYRVEGEAAKFYHYKRQLNSIGNSYWTSMLKSDCSEPSTWKKVYPDTQWEGFQERCQNLFSITKEYLQGKHSNWCRTFKGDPATPWWWGGPMDRADKSWEEINCDEPGARCENFDWQKEPNNTKCARNRWYRP